MKPHAVETTSPNKRYYAMNAKHGAVMTCAMFTTTTAMASLMQPKAMKDEVIKCGGALKYVSKYASGMVILAAVGALISVGLAAVIKHTKPNVNPKAVN